MGTSTSNKGTRGKGTPLVPTWLEPSDNISPVPQPGENPQESAPPPIPAPADPNRFRTARTNFNRFVRSGGRDVASLHRAVSGYITRGVGGPHRAAQSMGASRKAGASILGFLSDAAGRGVHEALRSLNLEQLVARPVEEIFLGLADYICPETGKEDEGIAKAAFIDTIAELATAGITDLGSLNIDQIQTVFELYVTHTIEMRIFNGIGNNGINLSPDIARIPGIQNQLHDFIRGAVEDALSVDKSAMNELTPDKTLLFVDQVYERTFSFLVSLGNSED
jgi:hypothetical protein